MGNTMVRPSILCPARAGRLSTLLAGFVQAMRATALLMGGGTPDLVAHSSGDDGMEKLLDDIFTALDCKDCTSKNCGFTGIEADMELSDMQCSGHIPESICELTRLKTLDLAENRLTGHLPSCLGNMQQLEVLDLSSNRLDGVIPDTIGQLKNLRVLYLNGNQLNGAIPETIGQLKDLLGLSLAKLDLHGNQLTQSAERCYSGHHWPAEEPQRDRSPRQSAERVYSGHHWPAEEPQNAH
eukprot:TRINITY_DN14996_c0_g1_i4.p1 TRINITY_DN14996_c0_g1~~TRINITY_DN14996_c0_g1_i4.p1  ORF type:complete len:239 (-),score=24.90 TRINITY_DN14996_c0_g1_i4:414-1130(-)